MDKDIRLPKTDSATGRGLKTALQALVTFFIGLIIVVANVPGVTDAVVAYTKDHIVEVIVAFGVPMTVGTGLTSFIYNWLFRSDVKTY